MTAPSPAAFTIDVDGLDCYRAIHGLPPTSEGAPDPIFNRALPRFLAAVEHLGGRATLFVIGKDLARPALAEVVAEAHRRGHEVASHSYQHDYGLSRRPRAVIDADLVRAREAIADVTGAEPVGFRAPGYNLSEALVDAVEATGHRYDSSLFPTPAYFGLRAAALARYRLLGRKSRSLAGDVREFAGPRAPFRPTREARYRPAQEGEPARDLIEIPMSVATAARLPWLGTTLALSADAVGRRMTQAVLRRPEPAVLEVHAMDFLGAGDGVEPALCRAHPDLKVPLATKLRRLEDSLSELARARPVVPLAELAERYTS